MIVALTIELNMDGSRYMKVKTVSGYKKGSWRVVSISAGALLLLAYLFLFTPDLSAQQAHFTDCANGTGDNGTVAITVGTVLPGVSFTPETGDEIAVFHPDPPDPDFSGCAGVVVYDSTQIIVITVWGDDSQTGTVDGMEAGEIMQWRIWDASADIEYFANVTYSACQGCTNTTGAYVASDGIWVLDSFVPNGPTAVRLAGVGAGSTRPANALLLFLAAPALILITITVSILKSPLRKVQ